MPKSLPKLDEEREVVIQGYKLTQPFSQVAQPRGRIHTNGEIV